MAKKEILTEKMTEYMERSKRDTFTCKLNEMLNDKNFNNVFMDDEKRTKIIDKLKSMEKKDVQRYRWEKRYEVIEVDDVSVLVKRRVHDSDGILFVPIVEELYDILHECHLATNHGGRDRMAKEVGLKYVFVTRQAITLYLTLCVECKLKQKSGPKKSVVDKPATITSSGYASRCHVDLIDYQNQPDGEYKFVLVYRDHFTNWVQLRPLKSKRAEEVAWKLYKIFTTFGAPALFHAGNGGEFEILVLHQLLSLWPECRLVPGNPRDSEMQASVARAIQDVRNRIAVAMSDRRTMQWSKILPYAQISKNRAFHSEMKCTPYESVFRSPLRVGLAGLPLPKHIQTYIVDEDQLLDALNKVQLNGVDCVNCTATSEVSSTEQQIWTRENGCQTVCYVCTKACANLDYCCKVCKNAIHATCGVARDDKDFVSDLITCSLCVCQETSVKVCSGTKRSQAKRLEQVEKMSKKRIKHRNGCANV